MPRPSRTRAAKRRSTEGSALPAPETVVLELPLVSPKREITRGRRAAPQQYRILRTTQVDEYEKPVSKATIGLRLALRAVVSDTFSGKARKAAKISISSAPTEEFSRLRDLIKSLPSEKSMVNRKPRITTGEKSGRVQEEERNVSVRAWLYAASRENDNDFHLIIGQSPGSSRLFMTVEISGLPPSSSAFHAKLKRARNSYKAFFKEHPDKLPGPTYDFYKPPIPIEIKGSLFMDIGHVKAGRPGPKDLRDDIPTVWEIHPVTKIEFEP